MSDLQSRVELEKLAAELSCPTSEIEFLVGLGVADLRSLRSVVSESLFARHEKRFAPLASLVRLVPTRISVKIAEVALGPLVSARIAGAVDAKEAAAMAKAMRPAFLADVAVLIDPVRIKELIPLLPTCLVMEVGRLMLDAGQHLALSRFVPIVSTQEALSVIEGASPEDTLMVALYCEDPAALADIIESMDATVLLSVIEHGAASGAVDDALTLIAGLDGTPRQRMLGLADDVSPESRATLLEAARRNDMPDLVAALT